MKSYLILSLAVLSITLFSCTENKKDGDWDDNIKLSLKSAEFNAEGDSVLITTKGDWWWVDFISVNDRKFYDFSNINLESENYTIKQDCFIVERRKKNTLVIKLDANPLNTNRIVVVGLEAGDYFDNVKITQKSH
jgi:hypothetical protein